jgi:hypothetical protein
MFHNLPRHNFRKALRQILCAALAVVMTALSTQLIAKSAGQHEYQIASTPLPTHGASPDTQWHITVARVR